MSLFWGIGATLMQLHVFLLNSMWALMSCTEERLPPRHSAIEPWLVEAAVTSDFGEHSSVSRLQLWSSATITSVFFFTSLTKALSPVLGRVLVILNYGGHCAPGNLECCRNSFGSLARSFFCHRSVSWVRLLDRPLHTNSFSSVLLFFCGIDKTLNCQYIHWWKKGTITIQQKSFGFP